MLIFKVSALNIISAYKSENYFEKCSFICLPKCIFSGTYTNQSIILTLDGSQLFLNPDTERIGTYDHLLDLQWTIILEPGKIVQLFFLTFDIEKSKDCLYDRLKVRFFV